ncbi:hypothetical protein MHY01S_29120 [Meiothermus hypogaeus NBRC 106114]|uniref:Uncharacterized protein n=1 Tax=Meiothermus hypogaeus NBRC 106114 TaxID=1227553 RepID=A0A511R6W3_9DEIN|nr:hypothetical protein MHY01S_29120 [Meiothermus hypogaeus NBRC 106114]
MRIGPHRHDHCKPNPPGTYFPHQVPQDGRRSCYVQTLGPCCRGQEEKKKYRQSDKDLSSDYRAQITGKTIFLGQPGAGGKKKHIDNRLSFMVG